MNAADQINEVVAGLRSQYPRPALRGRLEQISAVASTLNSLIEQLPDEEEREAEYADRLVASYKAGAWRQPGHEHTYSDAAAERLQHATSGGN